MILLTGLLSLAVTPQAASDEITFLPGWTGALPSKHYSGYLPVGNASGSPGMLHYWLQESEGDPATDPVIMWINGGPGASGMIGMLTELGQLQTMPSPGDPAAQPASPSATPTLYYNKFGWTKVGSLFTIEQPKGVGFSYCTGKGKCVNTDESTAQDTYEALVAFFERFPALKSRPFYVTGESYAGTYLPMLMDQIDLRGGLPNFAGAAIGNGCWGSECFYGVTESQIDYHTFAGQMFISPTLTEQIGDACEGRWEQVTSTEGACGGGGVDKCPRALQQMCTEVCGAAPTLTLDFQLSASRMASDRQRWPLISTGVHLGWPLIAITIGWAPRAGGRPELQRVQHVRHVLAEQRARVLAHSAAGTREAARADGDADPALGLVAYAPGPTCRPAGACERAAARPAQRLRVRR